jgi:hypothetical protein
MATSDDHCIRHEPGVRDGVAAFKRDLEELVKHRSIDEIKFVLGQGDFVFIAAKGSHESHPCVYIDLYRVEDGKIAERWGFPEEVLLLALYYIEVAYGNAWSESGHAACPLTPNLRLPEQRTCGPDPIRNIGDSRIPIAKRFSKPKSYIFEFSLLIKSRLAWLLREQRVCGFSRRIFHLAES